MICQKNKTHYYFFIYEIYLKRQFHTQFHEF